MSIMENKNCTHPAGVKLGKRQLHLLTVALLQKEGPQQLPPPLGGVSAFSDLGHRLGDSPLKHLRPKAAGITSTAETAVAGLAVSWMCVWEQLHTQTRGGAASEHLHHKLFNH